MASKLKLAEDSAWTACSKFIRLRDCLKTTGQPDAGRCFTCGKWAIISELDAGHFVSRRAKLIMFHEDNLRGQCRSCNRFMDGNIHEYYPRLVKDIGEERVQYLIDNRWTPYKRSVAECAELKQYFIDKYKELANGTTH